MLQYESIVIPPITPGCMSFSGILLIANIEFPSRTCCYCGNLVPLSLTGQGMNTIEVPIMIIIEASVAVNSFVDQSRFLDHPLVPRSLLSIDALLLNPWLFLDHFRSLIDLCFFNQRWAPWSLFASRYVFVSLSWSMSLKNAPRQYCMSGLRAKACWGNLSDLVLAIVQPVTVITFLAARSWSKAGSLLCASGYALTTPLILLFLLSLFFFAC